MVLSSTAPRRGFNVALVLSVIGVILGGFAVFASLFMDRNESGFSVRSPFGGSLKKYDEDLKTPAGTYKALMQMERDRDRRALDAYELKFEEKQLDEKLQSFKVESEADYKREAPKDKPATNGSSGEFKVLFVSFKQDSKDKKEVVVMEKFTEPNLWRPAGGMIGEIKEKNKEVGKKIDDWK